MGGYRLSRANATSNPISIPSKDPLVWSSCLLLWGLARDLTFLSQACCLRNGFLHGREIGKFISYKIIPTSFTYLRPTPPHIHHLESPLPFSRELGLPGISSSPLGHLLFATDHCSLNHLVCGPATLQFDSLPVLLLIDHLLPITPPLETAGVPPFHIIYYTYT